MGEVFFFFFLAFFLSFFLDQSAGDVKSRVLYTVIIIANMRRERNSGEDKRQSCKLNRRSRGAGRLVSDGGV